jgi:RNA recognition motif-containing protein
MHGSIWPTCALRRRYVRLLLREKAAFFRNKRGKHPNLILKKHRIRYLYNNCYYFLMNIFVGNVDFRSSEQDLRARFEAYGEVISCKIISDRDTGRSKGFAFVEMADDEGGRAAIDGLNGQQVGNRALAVSEARPRDERPRTGGGGGGGGEYRKNNRY